MSKRRNGKMLKRIAALLLSLLLMAQILNAAAEELDRPFVVGSTTQMTGSFFTTMWGGAASDADVRELLHGYNLVRWDSERMVFTEDTSVVSGITVTQDEQGNSRFIVMLQDDLFYSDGVLITAWDYAFSFLLTMSPVIDELGGTPIRRDYLKGAREYQNGKVPYLSGVQVIDDYRLAITVRREYAASYFELGMLDCNPYPYHVIAPGCMVMDDGDGVYIGSMYGIEKPFTAELLNKTIMDEEEGYRRHPSVVSGPYVLSSFDGITAEFEANLFYKGDYRGKMPAIQTLRYTLANNDDMVQKLKDGEFDLLNKVTRKDALYEAMNDMLLSKRLSAGYYPRSGLSFIAFFSEQPALESVNVRQAIACCIDKEKLVDDYLSGFGAAVDGYYGIGQWTYRMATGVNTQGLTIEGVQHYDTDPERAAQLLEEDGWTLNRKGKPFRPGVDDTRCKLQDGKLNILMLTLAYPEGHAIAECLKECFIPYLEEAGIRLTLKPLPMNDLLAQYYQQEEREADMAFLAGNFSDIYDYSINFIQNDEGEIVWKYAGFKDDALYELASDLRKTPVGESVEYCRKWISFQERFSQVLPLLPLYSNVYYDFYTSALRNYLIAQNGSWPQAIMDAYIDMSVLPKPAETPRPTATMIPQTPPPPEGLYPEEEAEEEEPEEVEDDFMFFDD